MSSAWMRARPGTKSSSRSAILSTASPRRATTANWYMVFCASLGGGSTQSVGPSDDLLGNAPGEGSAPLRYVADKTEGTSPMGGATFNGVLRGLLREMP